MSDEGPEKFQKPGLAGSTERTSVIFWQENLALVCIPDYLTQVHQVRVVDPHKMVSGKKFFVMLEMK